MLFFAFEKLFILLKCSEKSENFDFSEHFDKIE